MRDNDFSLRTGRPRCVLQIRGGRPAFTHGTGVLAKIQVQPIDIDDQRGNFGTLRIDVSLDAVDLRGRGENDGGLRVAQYRAK